MTPRRTIRPARPEKPPPDAQGLIRFLRYLGLQSPELSPVAPVVGRLMAELLVLEVQSASETSEPGPTMAGTPTAAQRAATS
jgi:hypothetical protein